MNRIGLLLTSDGKYIEKELDMTEGKNSIGELLDDKITFLGQILREPEYTNAIIMYGKNAETFKKDKNKCIVPLPFENIIYGDIFIICMNKDSEPENFTLKDYNEYMREYFEIYEKKYNN